MRHTGYMSAMLGGVPRLLSANLADRVGKFCRNVPACLGALVLMIALAGLAAGPAQAQQITIDPSQRIGAVPSFAGTGLDGSYYYFPGSNMGSLSDAANLVSTASGPTGTFSTTNICFPDCLGNPFDTGSGGLAAFTNGNATNISYLVPMGQVPTSSFYETVLDITGYLAIPTAGTYTFSINSDDGSQLAIGNALIDLNDGIHGQQIVSNSAYFSAAGLYAIAVTYFQNGGGAGLDLTATNSAGACFFGCQNNGGDVQPNSLFYSSSQFQGAPAPTIGGGWPSLACFAVLGAGALIRRQRRTHRI